MPSSVISTAFDDGVLSIAGIVGIQTETLSVWLLSGGVMGGVLLTATIFVLINICANLSKIVLCLLEIHF